MERKKEISIKELFLNVILKWRLLLITGLCLSIIVFLSSYVNSRRENTLSKKDVILTEEEEQIVEDIKQYEKKITQQRKYVEDSILMNIDPMKKNIYVLQCYVNSGYTFNYLEDSKMDYTPDIVSAYVNLIQSSKVAEAIVDKMDLKEEAFWIKEAISVEKDNYSFTITFTYPEKEKLYEIGTAIKDSFKDYEEKWTKQIGEYSLEIVNEYQTTVVDEDLVIKQNEVKSALQFWENEKKTMLKSLTSAQLSRLDGNESDSVGSNSGIRISLKKVVLGFCVGILAGMILFAVIYIMSPQLHYSQEIEAIYGVNLLGELTTTGGKRKFLGFIDKILIKILCREKQRLSYEEIIKIICSKIYVECQKAEVKNIYLIGSNINRVQEVAIEKIKEALNEKHIYVNVCGSILENHNMIESSLGMKISVILEQNGESRYNDIEEEVKFIRQQNIQILGAVIIDSK